MPREGEAPPTSLGRRVARRFLAEEAGATMVEYGMIVALIALMVMGALYLMGGSIAVKLARVATCVSTRVC
jgi:pilus assembly protein Flp/PilA